MIKDQDQVIKALNDLYIIQRKKYIKQVNGKTYTQVANSNNQSRNGRVWRTPYLNDKLLKQHLKGTSTYGVFARYNTKFMLFDFDFENDFRTCEWYFHKVKHSLIDLGVPKDCIYAINSGGKGIHLTIYFDEPISVKQAKDLYNLALGQVLDDMEYTDHSLNDLKKKIEFRPTDSQAVKLPLGYHFKTKKKSHYVRPNDLAAPLSDDTILNVNKLSKDDIYAILDIETNSYDKLSDKEVQSVAKQELYSEIKDLDIYELGKDKTFTLDYYRDILANGIKAKGTRHKQTLMLSIFLKDHMSMTHNDVLNTMLEWTRNLDKTFYNSTLDDALKDTHATVRDVFEKDYKLNLHQEEIHVSVNELKTILTARNSKNKHLTHKQRVVLFALLLHGKRYSKKGIFYMTYDQIQQATDISRRSIPLMLNEFEQAGLIKIHSRNQAQEGTHIKLPNQYEILFIDEMASVEGELVSEEQLHDKELFTTFLIKFVPLEEIKTTLPRKQYEMYRQASVS